MRVAGRARFAWWCVAVLAIAASVGGVAPPARAETAPPITWIGGGTVGVRGVAVSPDGAVLATVAEDHTVKLWRVADRRLVHTLTGHAGVVRSVAFTPDGRFVASGGEIFREDKSTSVKLWRVADGALIAELDAPRTSGNANAVAVSPDGRLVATGHEGGQVHLFRVGDGVLVGTLTGHTDQVLGLALSPDGGVLASASADRTVRVWRVADGALLRILPGHAAAVTAVAFAPDGATLASGSADRTVRLWRAATFAPIRTLNHTEAVTTVGFSADSQTVASGGGLAGIRLWQAATGALRLTIPGTGKHAVQSLTFVGSAGLTAGGLDGHVRSYRVADGTLSATFGDHVAGVRAVAFSADGTLLASAGDDTTAKLWRASDGALLRTLDGHRDRVNAVAFSPDGGLIATAAGANSADGDSPDTTVNIWRTGDGTLVRSLSGHIGGSTGVAFSADGQTVISAGLDLTLRFWRVADGALVREVTDGIPHGVLAISPDRTVVATLGFKNRAINLYSTVDGSLVRVASAARLVNALAFSGDGSLLAAGEDGLEGNVELFRVADAALVRTLAGDPNGSVQGVAFAPDGDALASSSGFSRVLRLWDPATGELRASFDRETGAGPVALLPVAFTVGGRLGYGRGDATVVVAAV